MSHAFRMQLDGYRLTTAEILYRMPDAQALLQSYVWQNYDKSPHFPRLREFLDFWARELDGPLYSVRVTSAELIGGRKYHHHQHSFSLH
ncbi:MAG: aspartate-semialdehyde dehydrogenase [Alphaproteobacteria bacterium]